MVLTIRLLNGSIGNYHHHKRKLHTCTQPTNIRAATASRRLLSIFDQNKIMSMGYEHSDHYYPEDVNC